MLCELHSVYKIIHCIHCVILHRGSQIIIHYTVKGQFFAVNLEKNYTRQKIFTQTPSVVSVTNMRYVFSWPSPFSVLKREIIAAKYIQQWSIEFCNYSIDESFWLAAGRFPLKCGKLGGQTKRNIKYRMQQYSVSGSCTMN